MHLWLFSSAVNVLDLSTEGANALFFMIDGQDVVLFGILIMETSDKRLLGYGMVALMSANINHSSRLSVYILFCIFDVIFSTILIFFLLC
jgi:hypothetical protein